MQRPIHALLLHNSAVTVQTSCTACSSDRHTFRSCVVAYRTKHCRVRTRSLFNTSLSLGYVRCTCQEPLLFLQCDYNMFDGDNMLERFKHRVQSAECRVQSAECRVQSAECRVQSAECRVHCGQPKSTPGCVDLGF